MDEPGPSEARPSEATRSEVTFSPGIPGPSSMFTSRRRVRHPRHPRRPRRPPQQPATPYRAQDYYQILSSAVWCSEAYFLSSLPKQIPAIFHAISLIPKAPVFYKPSTQKAAFYYTHFMLGIDPSIKAFSSYYTKERMECVRAFFIKHQGLRLSFKKLLTVWRRSRWLAHPLNTEDPFTLCEPEKPVTLFDPASKGTYTFESEALLKHIHKSLLHHDGLYDEPIQPKNPLTNIPFHLGQLKVIYDSCKAVGHGHWAFELFRMCSFSIAKFQIRHAFQLKRHAIQATFADTSSYELREYLADFIDGAYGDQDLDYPSTIYSWAMRFRMDTPYMILWANLAKQSALADLEAEYKFSEKDEDMFTTKSVLLIKAPEFKELQTDYLVHRRVGVAFVLVQSPIDLGESSSD